ncbi:MAG: hypothetical protein ACLU4Q_02945 [Streptococcus thermophilus]
MTKMIKTFQVVEFDDGTVRVINSDKRQMARWFALDYFVDKPQLTQQGLYVALLSQDYYFSAGLETDEVATDADSQ